MSEQAYERRCAALETKYAFRIRLCADGAVNRVRKNGWPREEVAEYAREAVEHLLLHHPAWGDITAVDISDVAREAAEAAMHQSY